MNNNFKKIADILLKCEENGGGAPIYAVNPDTYKEAQSPYFKQMLPERTEPVKYESTDEELFVVSDLHIAAGRNFAGVYKGTENFFADDSFHRFLENAHNVKMTKRAVLVINGDVFDFIRIVDFPGRIRKVRWSKRFKLWLKHTPLKKPAVNKDGIEREFSEWQSELEKIGIIKTAEDLKSSISTKEREFGLQTDDFKTVYKLIKICNGHPEFFDALSLWLERGNRIIMVKGNHDVELYWLAVRNYMRLVLAERIVKRSKKNLPDVLKSKVLPNLAFIDDAVLIDNDFYLEHGHRYDRLTMILDCPVLEKNTSQINIPFGSFFNRYVINKVELFLPFFDNIRPQANMMSILMKENIMLALKLVLKYFPFAVRMLFKDFRYVWFMFNKVFVFLLALLIPAGLLAYFLIYHSINIFQTPALIQNDTLGLNEKITDALKWAGSALISYLLARLSAWFQLTEPDSLEQFARLRFEDIDKNYRIITMGHTHNPGEYVFKDGKRFYNTGTWIPIIETSTSEVREDKTYTYLHLIRDEKNRLQPAKGGLLERWNDNAGRGEPLILMERK